MPGEKRIYRFDPEGEGGLTPMTLDPADFHDMPAAQNVHVYYQDDELGMSAGVWDTTPMQEAFGPYPGDEFIIVLDGHFDMMDSADGSGRNVACKKGQGVIFRNGIPISWKQHDYLKKFYITYMDPRAETPLGLAAEGGVIALDPDITLTDADMMDTDTSVQRDRIMFTNDHGNFTVGMWDTQTMHTTPEPFPWHEFAQVLEGEVFLTGADGVEHRFGPGEVFFIPAGTITAWRVPQYLRKFYAALDPSIRPGG
ncbi:MAG: cupin domain-containing protein [Rhodobacteraceae bacterium]|nr:cupin domain-containing protein [Paracoccaceae bacterium]